MVKKSCEHCNGMCCRYVALEIDKPEELADFENIKWYVSHKNVIVFIDEDDEWYIEFSTPCKFLGEDNRCKNYESRPKICREYTQGQCLFYNNDYSEKHTFRTIEDVEKYIKENFKDDNKCKSKT
jgi:Fe-S-cluster containining protein